MHPQDLCRLRLAGLDAAAFWIYLIGGAGFVLVFLTSGAASIPRRWAEHLPQWVLQSQLGAIFGALIVAGAAVFVGRYCAALLASRDVRR